MSLVPWWLKLIALAALAAAFAWGTHLVLEHFRQEGRDEIQAKWDADKIARIKRTTDIVMDFTTKEAAHDEDQRQRRAVMDSDFSALALRASSGPVRTVSVSAAADRLLDDIVRAANADRTKDPAADRGADAGAAAVPGAAETHLYDERELDAWKVAAGKSYRDAYDLWKACRIREDGDRATIDKLTGATL